ncbi:MAG: Hsp20/alpha crystallin family protein [Planctomycetia bacterium]|nr:Hsp20/alpha crystallin family protein [Planctomycetia bacterium]
MITVSCGADCKLLDLKTRYDIEIPAASEFDSFCISVNSGTLQVSGNDKGGQSTVLGTWDIKEGVHTEAMTTEFRDGVLYIRLPKGDEVRPRELQYSEKICVTPTV